MANIRKMWEEEDEEALRQQLLCEKESTVKAQLVYIRKKEKENQKLREKNAELTAELGWLSVGDKYREEIQNLRAVEQKYKKFVTLIKKNNAAHECFNTMQDLRQEQGEPQEEPSSGEEEQIAALNLQNESKTSAEQRQPQDSSTMDNDEKHKDERPLKTERWWHRCAKALWKGVKVAGNITLCVLLSVCLVVYMVPDCISPDPDCSLWDIAFDLLMPYSELSRTLPPVY
ncbi:trichohyalin-like isoform X4 [Trachinotus anak]